MFNICNEPDIMECSDIRCWLTNGCRYLDMCMNKLVDGVYSGMSCACGYIENGNQVYQLPECIIYTASPSISPTNSPTMNPANSSILGHTMEESAKEHVDENLVYYIVGPCVLVLLFLLYFRKKFMECFSNCNRVDDNENI
jgi:hypothetical protein